MMEHQVRMVFRRRGQSLRPINSVKHIIDVSGALTAGNASIAQVAVTVPALSATFKPGDLRIGEKVNGMYISIFIIGSTGAPISGPINWYIWKEHTGQATSLPTAGNTGISPLRQQIFHEEKGLSGSGDGTPMVFKGVIAIPKGMRTMREGDSFQIVLNGDASDTLNFCVKCIYKSYY